MNPRLNFTPPPPSLTDTRNIGSAGVFPQPMSPLRLTAIAFSLTLLVACGGGGGGGAAAAPTTPPTNMPGTGAAGPHALPTALITDLSAVRGHINGSTIPPTTLTSSTIQETFQDRAMDAGRLIASDALFVTPSMPQGANASSRSITIGDITFRASLEDIRMGMANRFGLTRFNSRYEPVMMHQGVTLAQYLAAGRIDENENFEYLSYGGWFTESAFSVDMLTVDAFAGDGRFSIFVGLSYGEESGSNPSGSNSAAWNGVMVGITSNPNHVVQGIAEIEIDDLSNPGVDIEFNKIRNLNTGAIVTNMGWANLTLTDGNFSHQDSLSGSIEGTFYGSTHNEVGGTFNRNSIIGAFGARQP